VAAAFGIDVFAYLKRKPYTLDNVPDICTAGPPDLPDIIQPPSSGNATIPDPLLYLSFDTTPSIPSTVSISGSANLASGVNSGKGMQFNQTATTISTLQVTGVNTIGNSFTVAAWIYLPSTSLSVHMKIASSKALWNDPTGWELEYFPSGAKFSFIGTDGDLISGTVRIPARTWAHLAATISGTTAYLFVNGKAINNDTTILAIKPSVRNLYVGSDNSTGGAFSGIIDEFYLFNQALDPAALVALKSLGSNVTLPSNSTSTSSTSTSAGSPATPGTPSATGMSPGTSSGTDPATPGTPSGTPGTSGTDPATPGTPSETGTGTGTSGTVTPGTPSATPPTTPNALGNESNAVQITVSSLLVTVLCLFLSYL
jgi:hypothetical protein